MKNVIILLSFVSISVSVFSQDLELQQYSQNVLLLNPSFAGSNKATLLSYDCRIDIDGPKLEPIIGFPSNTFSIDHYFNKIKSGIGINFNSTYPVIDWNELHKTRAGLDYSFHIPIGKDSAGNTKYFLQPGFEYAYQYNVLDTTDFFGTYYPYYPFNNKVGYSDLSAGFIFYGKDICVGFSARHLNQPNEAFLGVYKLPVFYSGSLVYTKRFIESKPNYFIQPNLFWTYKNGNNTFLIGFKIDLDLIYVGMAYKTSQEIIAYTLGLHFGVFQLSYVYEHIGYVSDYVSASVAHEVTLRMKLFTKKNKDLVSTKNIL